jgi:predicted TIM-barrel enzyme
MPRLERQAILAKLQAMKKADQLIIGVGAGTGLSAKCEEAGGIDLIVIYNSCRYRMAGRGSLAGIVCHLDLTAAGTIGAHTGRKLEECPKLVDERAEAALDVNPEAIILFTAGRSRSLRTPNLSCDRRSVAMASMAERPQPSAL